MLGENKEEGDDMDIEEEVQTFNDNPLNQTTQTQPNLIQNTDQLSQTDEEEMEEDRDENMDVLEGEKDIIYNKVLEEHRSLLDELGVVISSSSRGTGHAEISDEDRTDIDDSPIPMRMSQATSDIPGETPARPQRRNRQARLQITQEREDALQTEASLAEDQVSLFRNWLLPASADIRPPTRRRRQAQKHQPTITVPLPPVSVLPVQKSDKPDAEQTGNDSQSAIVVSDDVRENVENDENTKTKGFGFSIRRPGRSTGSADCNACTACKTEGD